MTANADGELHWSNMIFRRQLITAATAIITLAVLLASTDVSVPPGSKRALVDTSFHVTGRAYRGHRGARIWTWLH